MGETMDLVVDSTHSDVALVNFYIFVLPLGLGMFPLIFGQLHINPIKAQVNILGCEVDPSGYSIDEGSVGQFDFAFDFRKLRNVFLDGTLPVSEFILIIKIIYLLARVLLAIPFVKVSEDRDVFRSRSPLLILEMVALFMDSILEVAFSDIVESSFCLELFDFILGQSSKFFEKNLFLYTKYFMRLKVRIVLDDLESFVLWVHQQDLFLRIKINYTSKSKIL